MYLQVDLATNPPSVVLREPRDLCRLSIRVDGEPNVDRLRIALSDYAGTVDGDHAYLLPSALRSLAGYAARNADWRRDFDGMIAYAAGHGWVDGHGAIRAHIEPASPSDPILPGGR